MMPNEHEHGGGAPYGGAAYRIRWAHVLGPWSGTRQMCLAEKRHCLLGLSVWWPVKNAIWHYTEGQALEDINDDNRQLPDTKYIYDYTAWRKAQGL